MNPSWWEEFMERSGALSLGPVYLGYPPRNWKENHGENLYEKIWNG